MKVLGVHVVDAIRGQGSVAFLRASEVLHLVLRESMAALRGMPMDDLTKAIVGQEVRKAVARQFQVRGFPSGEEHVVWTAIDIVESEDGYTLMCDPGWTKQVDFLLGNRDCAKCGGLIVTGIPHRKEDCDLVIVGDVIDS